MTWQEDELACKARRREHVLDALYHRRKKNRSMVKMSLIGSGHEKLKLKYFIGETPF